MCILRLLTSRRVSRGTEAGFRPDWRQIHRGGKSYRRNLINACNRFLEQGAPRWSSGRAAFLRIVRIVPISLRQKLPLPTPALDIVQP
jgi:hypothetical protein